MSLSPERIERALTDYRRDGFARLGKVLEPSRIAELGARIDQIMLGEVSYPGLFFQHDTDTGRYEDLAYGKGYEGPSLRYRKVEKLEKDPLFLAYLEDPVFAPLVTRVTGPEVSIYRALVFAKAADTGGSSLPWHQDGGLFWGLDRDPELQLWTALDDVPLDGGCVEVVVGSHRGGLVTRNGGVIPQAHIDAGEAEARAVPLPAEAGEVLLIHNHLWHRSRRSQSGKARRALTVCYMDGATRCLRTKRAPRVFPRVFAR